MGSSLRNDKRLVIGRTDSFGFPLFLCFLCFTFFVFIIQYYNDSDCDERRDQHKEYEIESANMYQNESHPNQMHVKTNVSHIY